jgi:hypothetical protein
VIYKGATSDHRAYYAVPGAHNVSFCGYDNAGNLFVDGFSSSSAFTFGELPSGGTSVKKILLDQSIGFPGGVQWDGTHVAVGDRDTNVIYQFAIHGTKGKKVDSTPIIGASDVNQFWTDGATVIGSDPEAADAMFWNYPAGGSRTKTIAGLDEPIGVTVSKGE